MLFRETMVLVKHYIYYLLPSFFPSLTSHVHVPYPHCTQHVGSAHNYSTSSAAKAAIAIVGREIQYGLLSPSIGPIVFTFTGSGNVSQVGLS